MENQSASNAIILYYYQDDDQSETKVLVPSDILVDVSSLQKLTEEGPEQTELHRIKLKLPTLQMEDLNHDDRYNEYQYGLYAQIVATKETFLLNAKEVNEPKVVWTKRPWI